MMLRDRTVTAAERKAKSAAIARKAKGPASRELAWEGWLQAERGWIPTVDEDKARARFEKWWDQR